MASVSRDPVVFDYDFEKILAALVYFAQDRRVTLFDKKKALSLIFLADKAHLLRYGEPIFGDFYGAPEYGAVPQETWKRLNDFYRSTPRGRDARRLADSLRKVTIKGHKHDVMVAKARPDLDALSDIERGILDEIIEKYGDKDFDQMKEPIHTRAWHNARKRHKNTPAPPMLFEEFFDEEPGVIEGSREHMLEEFRFRRALSGRRR
jgi:hypothetical protein